MFTTPIPQEVFVELMEYATSSVEFSFNNKMYHQIDGAAIGLPLGPALANIVVGFYDEKIFLIFSSDTRQEINVGMQERKIQLIL